MSDSIETIYLAAKADSGCDAYWIPVPYFDKNADGMLGEMHYEGQEHYPDYLECTDWQHYDIEARHPDVIFTFAPYDAGNYVTSVHPLFYCERMRKLTDCLVYVPYYVAGEQPIPESFPIVAGCVFAHKVILESEKMRSFFVEEFRKTFGNQLGKPEDKFVALGSPKYDKVINTKREDCKLPIEWQTLIGDKKVILYNTTVGAVLHGGEQYLRKLRSVLAVFRERDDMILWWRPHPLSMNTFDSMRPQLAKEYRAIVSEYQAAGFGIYDDTADMHRSIAWSDAYYGDMSSLVALYRKKEMPQLIQNVNITDYNNEKELIINFVNFRIVNDTIWGIAREMTGLFSMDLRTQNIRLHGRVSNEQFFSNELYRTFEVLEGNIVLIPCLGSRIVKYNVANKQFIIEPKEYTSNINFSTSFTYNDNVCAVSYEGLSIIGYSPSIGEVYELKKDAEHLGLSEEIHLGNFTDYIVHSDLLLLVSTNNNIVIEYDLKQHSCRCYEIGNKENKYAKIEFCGLYYWLFTLSGEIMKWNKTTGEIRSLSIFPKGFIEDDVKNYFSHTLIFGTSIFAFPYLSNMILKIDMENEKIDSFINIKDRRKSSTFSEYEAKYYHVERFGNHIYAYSNFEKCLQKITPDTGDIENIPLVLSSNDYNDIMCLPFFYNQFKETNNSRSNTENELLPLPLFVNKLASETICEKQMSASLRNDNVDSYSDLSGTKTYNYVRSIIQR
ncbi:MAG: CDP-glycerol glycerophosphotransferase family protein [Lachnospiraceae bacterium]|nr:CDP-glycerol glycerophosphotransferase family protein [Lachnospiraceae bacterium]